jgi:phage shock protein PspC (stress-responsive transcriptional regulator)
MWKKEVKQGTGGISVNKKRLYRTQGSYRMLGGVCGGIAEYFDIDPTLVRVACAIATICGSVGFWAYLACLVIIPKKSDIYPGC